MSSYVWQDAGHAHRPASVAAELANTFKAETSVLATAAVIVLTISAHVRSSTSLNGSQLPELQQNSFLRNRSRDDQLALKIPWSTVLVYLSTPTHPFINGPHGY